MSFLKGIFGNRSKVPKVDLTRRFDLIARVGQGSMSKVWRARDTMTGKIVALKVLDKAKTDRFEARFAGLNKPSEGEIAVQLRHPHIVRTYEHGITRDDEQFLVMEFLEGVGLSYLVDVQNEVMQENRLRFIIQLGLALDYFHKENWIHRDICPRNVIITRENEVKLIDFGLVVPNTPDFRKPGNRTGTANYMAPELIKRQRTDQRIDIFGYAVSCYEMYTRTLPWDAAETIDMALQHINRPPRDIREYVSDVDEQIAEAIMKGLAVEPAQRWPSVSKMLAEFRKAHARLTGSDEFAPEPEKEEELVPQAAPARKSKVRYWSPDDEDDEDEYTEAELVVDEEGYIDADSLIHDDDDDEYEEVTDVLDD